MRRSYIILAVLLFFALGSCIKIEKLPPEPMIDFREFTLSDSTDILGNPVRVGKLTFYFEDGDGDLGLPQPDSDLSEEESNLFLKLYRKTDGIFELVGPTEPLYPSEYRIPQMVVPSQNRILKGTIDVSMIYFLYDPHDTLYYDFWVRDRSGNESNTESTCVIVLGDSGPCKDL
ncbi:MAG: hypothetical protein L0Y37_03535 [Bacteroidales bacterium]|nr:hypothetical protein [Bacteroidales bacterium]